MPLTTKTPLAVIGAGPVGLAAAAQALSRGLPVRVFEAGPTPGANVRDWGHVRLFSPWRMLVEPAGLARLDGLGWEAPDLDALPTGAEFAARWLDPLAESMADVIRLGTRVIGVRRPSGPSGPFVLTLRRAQGGTETVACDAVIDASGTWASPNPIGADGRAAGGEDRAPILYGTPDVLGTERERFAARRVLVAGAGHSAAHVLIDLARLPGTEITWIVRGGDPVRLWGGGENDALPARGALGAHVKALVASGRIRLVSGFSTRRVERDAAGATVVAADGRWIGPVDVIVAATGQHPDLAPLADLALDLDPDLEAPRALAPLIDPRMHSCGTVPPHGHALLAHPEPRFWIAGAKSYGRAPTFLMATGYEQVRSIVANLAGDRTAADEVRLVLPETGACSGGGSACCGGPARTVGACCALDSAAKRSGAAGCGCRKETEKSPAAV